MLSLLHITQLVVSMTVFFAFLKMEFLKNNAENAAVKVDSALP